MLVFDPLYDRGRTGEVNTLIISDGLRRLSVFCTKARRLWLLDESCVLKEWAPLCLGTCRYTSQLAGNRAGGLPGFPRLRLGARGKPPANRRHWGASICWVRLPISGSPLPRGIPAWAGNTPVGSGLNALTPRLNFAVVRLRLTCFVGAAPPCRMACTERLRVELAYGARTVARPCLTRPA